MMNSNYISVYDETLPSEEDFHSLFSDIEPLEPFDIKKEEIAAQLSALLAHTKLTRTQLSVKSGWKKSRITNILNGRGNPTFKTLWEFARNLGYEADIIFRKPSEAYAKQPWQKSGLDRPALYSVSSSFPLVVKSAQEVAKDLVTNNYKTHYVTYCDEKSVSAASTTQSIPAPSMPNSLITIPANRMNEVELCRSK